MIQYVPPASHLSMMQSTYDPCLLYTSDNSNGFGIIGMQTDNTLILADEAFARSEEEQLIIANIMAKGREKLSSITPIKFNGGIIKQNPDGSIYLNQKKQCKNLRLIDLKTPLDLIGARRQIRKVITPKDQYVAQKIKNACVAIVFQPEASFDLFFAAQVINPKEGDAKLGNKRLK